MLKGLQSSALPTVSHPSQHCRPHISCTIARVLNSKVYFLVFSTCRCTSQCSRHAGTCTCTCMYALVLDLPVHVCVHLFNKNLGSVLPFRRLTSRDAYKPLKGPSVGLPSDPGTVEWLEKRSQISWASMALIPACRTVPAYSCTFKFTLSTCARRQPLVEFPMYTHVMHFHG